MKKRLSNLSFNFRFAFLGMLFLLSLTSAVAQSSISGIVTDEDNLPIPNANILIKGSSEGTVTDLDGKFSLNTSLKGEQEVAVSFIGYQTMYKKVQLNGQAVNLNFQLNPDAMSFDEVLVTGVMNEKSKLASSVSVTTLDPKIIEQSAPRTTAEVFRNIPGIKAEASAGDGNTNITVRGVPISSGGSRYLQLQEDGLPILLYGDIAFSTQDQYLRLDPTVARIEAIRGGSAATATSNGPAGIINFISKTGNVAGGTVRTSFGVDYQSMRTEFNYGAPIGNGLSFNIGGFFRQGEGPRNANTLVNNGGQIKANLTKRFDNGTARVYFKMLNDRTAAYMPMPIQVSGTNANPTWESVDGLNAASNGLHSPFFQQSAGFGPNGERRTSDINDGIHSKSSAVGVQFDFDLGNGWQLNSSSRMAINGGRFIAPFTAQVGTTSSLMEGILRGTGDTTAGGAVSPYTINRVTSGEEITDTDNGLAQRIHLFDVELENFNNFMSDTRVSKKFGNIDLTLGAFYGQQNIQMSWLWNSFLMEVQEDGQLLNINSNGRDITDNGQLAYGVPFWDNCCVGKYSTSYNNLAPYANVALSVNDNLNIDAGLRYDFVTVNGLVTPSQNVANVDVNGNGVIDVPEQSVARVDNNNARAVNYSYDYLSYSLGVNYKLSDNNAVFARASQGYVGNGERATWHQGGPYLENLAPKNSLFQGELGYKQRFKAGGIFVTAFYAQTKEEAGVEATTQNVLSNDYQSYGLEVESFLKIKNLDVRAALTYVDAEIIDNDGLTNIGNTPRRQPGLSYNLLPSYNFKGGHVLGLSVMGQTSSYAQDDNQLIMPGYAIINGFVSFQIKKGLNFNLNVNNLTNTIGITESEEGSITEGQVNYLRARSIAGRSIVAGIVLNF